jgi:hypothetical protein
MKNSFFLLLTASLISLSSFAEEDMKFTKKISGDGTDSVLIETTKGAKARADFEIVSGEEEISGDPTAGRKEAMASWRQACNEWKKELKENNKDGHVVIASCGTAKFALDDSSGAGSGIYTYRSEGKYKIRVRIREK